MDKKIVIWDLFGGEENSVKKSIDLNKFEVITFDINNKFPETIIVDLTRDDIVEFFKDYPKPDIIIASPPCDSWSRIMALTKYKHYKGNANWYWDDQGTLRERENTISTLSQITTLKRELRVEG